MVDIRNFELSGRWFFDAFIWFIESLNSIWTLLWSPISSYVNVDFGEGFVNDFFEGLVQSTVNIILTVFPSDISIFTLILGSGFSVFLVLTIMGFVRRVV